MAAGEALAQADPVSRSWNQPVEPFRIATNLYYVGASDITSFLITTPKGHILLDSGFVETVPQVLQNIPKLGFRVEDVRILINSHAHYDHAGGLRLLQRLTGARLAASRRDVPLLRRGGRGDFAFDDRFPYDPPRIDRVIDDGDRVSLGGVTLTARLTPGHTRGCLTWTMRTDDRLVVFVGSASVPGYQLANNSKYPEIVEDYRHTFATLRSLPADIFLGAHGAFFALTEKTARLRAGEKDAFVDPDGYKKYVEEADQRFEKILAEQK